MLISLSFNPQLTVGVNKNGQNLNHDYRISFSKIRNNVNSSLQNIYKIIYRSYIIYNIYIYNLLHKLSVLSVSGPKARER